MTRILTPSESVSAIEPLVVPGPFSSLTDRLQHVADATPDALALTAPSGSFTFAQLLDRVERLAAALLEVLPAGDEPVGVLVAHDASAVLLPLALTRIDRVYVNLDPAAPAARLADVVELSGMRACVVEPDQVAALAAIDGLEVIVPAPRLEGPRPVLPAAVRSGQDAAFVVFTSGSTGRPKGVIETHLGMLNDACICRTVMEYGPGTAASLLFPMAFVGGPVVVYGTLLNGASLHVFDARHATPRAVLDWIGSSGITTLGLSPHLLRAVTAELGPDERISGLRSVMTGGEGIMGQDVEAFRAHLAEPAFYLNGMGSSEATSSTSYRIEAGDRAPDGTVPAGRPNVNREVWILRDDGSRAEPGETGRLMIVSDYMSGGYWRDDAANAEKFGHLPDGRRTYLQGDLGRFDASGVLTLVGRADTAVKIRGYLVDVSEVEDALRSNPKVAEVLVVPVVEPDRPTRLVAYVVQKAAVRPDSVADLRRQLRARLPEYMVPGVIVPLAALPRNERGKVDRTRLPVPIEPEFDDVSYTQHEKVVSGIWAALLGIDRIPLDGDFLALGGDSLAVEEMLAEVSERFGVELTSADLLAAPTLGEFSAVLSKGAAARPRGDDLVRLQIGLEDSHRVFCFAGAGALALQFLPLTKRLAGWDVWAFQAHGLEQRAKPDWSVGAHAQRFVRRIRAVQPHGPYRLVGHSFGGLVALEVAQRLRASGEEVELLAVLDSFLPQNAEAERDIVDQFGRLEERRSAGAFSHWLASVLPKRQQEPGRLTRSQIVLQSFRARTAGLIRYPGQLQFDAFFQQGVLAARGYRARPYSGRTLVVSCDGNPNLESELRTLFPGDLALAHVHSEHSGLLREPRVAELAEVLLARLQTGGVSERV